ncbi:heparin lyase I family protein [Maribacter sp. 2308TA10-17]|uniref:heparin lyase I family protein n=1 Tax=Maribacter sp. 2308TA10-17 TaxID=3386276 RepID=UPI0039BCB197
MKSLQVNFSFCNVLLLATLVLVHISCKNNLKTSSEKVSKKEVVSVIKPTESLKRAKQLNSNCYTDSGKASEAGTRVWCWSDVKITEDLNSATNFFSSNHLAVNSHCNNGMVTGSGDRLYFKVNPTTPTAQEWCKYDFNYRAEIREHPSDVDHPVGTEQWFGWDYKFGEDYEADAFNEWIMWQVHGSFKSPANPLISLWVAKTNMAKKTNTAGEIFVTNAAINSKNHKYTPTGIVPKAGQTLDIVVHVVWGDENTGLYEVWIDDKLIYSEQERTVYQEEPIGGYAKWGIYKWKWQSASNIAKSASEGIIQLNTSMGPLRVLMRRPGDQDYLQNSFALVKPK